MRSEHYLFHVLAVNPVILIYNTNSMLFGVRVLCRFWYCLVCCLLFKRSFSRLITSVLEERAGFLLSIIRNVVVSVRRSSLFLWVLRKGCCTPVPSI